MAKQVSNRSVYSELESFTTRLISRLQQIITTDLYLSDAQSASVATLQRKVVTGSVPHGIAAGCSTCQDYLSCGEQSLSAGSNGRESPELERKRIYFGDT